MVQIVSIVTIPIFTRVMSTSEYGQYSVYSSFLAIIAVIIGIQTYGTLNNAKIEFGESELNSYCTSVLMLSFISLGIVSILFFAFHVYIREFLCISNIELAVLLISSFGMYCVTFLSTYYVARKDAEKNLLISFLIALSTTGLSVYFVLCTDISKYAGRIWGLGIPYFVALLLILWKFRRKEKSPVSKYWRFCIPIAIPLVFHDMAGLVLEQADRVMLKSMIDDGTSGIYSFCYTIGMPISIVWGALNSAWIPEYYERMKEGRQESINSHSADYIYLFTSLTCGFLLIYPEAVRLMADQKYWSGMNIIPLIILGYYLNYLYSFPANYEFYHKKTKYIAFSTVLCAILNVILNFHFIPLYNMMGAAVATILSYLVMFIFHDLVARYIIRGYHYSIIFYMRGLGAVILCVAVTITLGDLMFVRWILAFLIALLLVYRCYKKRRIF